MDNKFEAVPEISEGVEENLTVPGAEEKKEIGLERAIFEGVTEKYPHAAKLEHDRNGEDFVFVDGVEGGPAVYIDKTGVYRISSAFGVIGDKRFNSSARIEMKDIAAEMLEATKKLDGKKEINNGWKKIEFSELGLTEMNGRPIERAVQMNGLLIKKTNLDNPTHTDNVSKILEEAEKRAVERVD
jgi:hypothetical protein